MDLHHFIGWLLVVGLFIVLPLLSRSSVRNFLGPPMIRLGSWILAQPRLSGDPDEERGRSVEGSPAAAAVHRGPAASAHSRH